MSVFLLSLFPLSNIQTLITIENHRASRVDLELHIPHDASDIFAIQRQSICVRSDATAWLYSEKRLGGHAYAGYGIFGHSSSADRMDQALAELHTDITVSYLRLEIQYAIHQKKAKAAFTSTAGADSKISVPIGIIPNNVPKTPGVSPVNLKSESTAIMTIMNVEKLSCLTYLKAYCGKNNYTRCLLFMEMARVEEGTDMRLEYLQVREVWISVCTMIAIVCLFLCVLLFD